MTLPSSWFYRGIMAGLSSKEEPLILATFNTDFYSHHQWLVRNDLHFIHGAPILLSKLQAQEKFCIVPELLKYHYFAWYLRPSRMVYDQKNNGLVHPTHKATEDAEGVFRFDYARVSGQGFPSPSWYFELRSAGSCTWSFNKE